MEQRASGRVHGYRIGCRRGRKHRDRLNDITGVQSECHRCAQSRYHVPRCRWRHDHGARSYSRNRFRDWGRRNVYRQRHSVWWCTIIGDWPDVEGMRGDPPSFAYSADGRTLALGVSDGTINLFELDTRKLRYHLINGHRGAVSALVFTADGRRLVSGSTDATALVWDLTGRLKTKATAFTSSDIITFWNDLKSDDAARAYQAIRRFAGVPEQTLPLLDKNLVPISAPDGKALASYIADLGSEIFAKRNAAMNELTKLGELAEQALSLALDKAPTLETRNRIKQLLDRLPNIGTSGEPLRQARAVEVLENIGNPQARQLLEKLAAGAPQANLTRDARATLERLRPR